jgi:hypothetical protein
LFLKNRSKPGERAAGWIAVTLAITSIISIAVFVALLILATRIDVDVPYELAGKLPLLRTRPDLIFAGESRTEYQVDAALVSKMTGRTAVNIAYDAGEPLAVLAAGRQQPERFQHAHVAISVAPFIFNEGVRSASVYPLDVVARLGVLDQLWSFLPLRIGTLFRYIREAFKARLASDQQLATQGPMPPALGLSTIVNRESDDRWPKDLGTHSHYNRWNLSGPKAHFEIAALCDLVPLVHRLTVVIPPWAPRYDRGSDELWREKDDQYDALIADAGLRCGFDVLNIQMVPGLNQSDYADEMHVVASGISTYTHYLVTHLVP